MSEYKYVCSCTFLSVQYCCRAVGAAGGTTEAPQILADQLDNPNCIFCPPHLHITAHWIFKHSYGPTFCSDAASAFQRQVWLFARFLRLPSSVICLRQKYKVLLLVLNSAFFRAPPPPPPPFCRRLLPICCRRRRAIICRLRSVRAVFSHSQIA